MWFFQLGLEAVEVESLGGAELDHPECPSTTETSAHEVTLPALVRIPADHPKIDVGIVSGIAHM
jgi:hypothetical protein